MKKKPVSGIRRRAPVVSGIFYPEIRENIARRLAEWSLKEGSACPAFGGQAILAPHGAWELTGNIAASAFAAIQGQKEKSGYQVRRVILLGKHHHSSEEGIYLSESSSFETPLGDIPVDKKLNQQLASCSTMIRVNDIPHLSEHSLEVHLPFVKYCFPAAKIVPILMSGSRPIFVTGLAKALRIILEDYIEESLVIISSNVSQNMDPADALSMANEFTSLLENTDSSAFLGSLAAGRISASAGALLGAFIESGLLNGKHFSALCPLAQDKGEKGETVYYGAFAAI